MEEDCVVGVDEFAVDEFIARCIAQGGRVAVAEHFDDFVVLIQERDDASKVRNEHGVVSEEVVTRTSHALGIEAHKLTVEGEILQSVILTIRDDEKRFVTSRIEPKTVGALDLPFVRT